MLHPDFETPEIVISKAGLVNCELEISETHMHDSGVEPSNQDGNLEDIF